MDKPELPIEPQKQIFKREELSTEPLDSGVVPEGATGYDISASVEYDSYGYGGSRNYYVDGHITFYRETVEDNPNYDEEMKKYKRKLAYYEKRYIKWQEEQDAEKEIIAKKQKRKELREKKKIFYRLKEELKL